MVKAHRLERSVQLFVRIIRGTGLAMDEPKHFVGSKPNMVGLGPFCICTAIRDVGCEHRPQIRHFLATFALGEAFGIDGALLCFRVKEFAPGVQVNDQHAAIHRLLMAAEPTPVAFALPRGIARATHDETLQRAVSAGSGHPAGWEGGWKVRLC